MQTRQYIAYMYTISYVWLKHHVGLFRQDYILNFFNCCLGYIFNPPVPSYRVPPTDLYLDQRCQASRSSHLSPSLQAPPMPVLGHLGSPVNHGTNCNWYLIDKTVNHTKRLQWLPGRPGSPVNHGINVNWYGLSIKEQTPIDIELIWTVNRTKRLPRRL